MTLKLKAPSRVLLSVLFAGAGALSLAAFSPGVARAQVSLGDEKPFTIGVQETTSYDSNPARGNSVNAALRGIRDDDVVVSPGITAVYAHNLGPTGLALNANLGYDYHIRNSGLNRENLGLSLVGNRAVGALCSVGGDAGFSQQQSDLSTLTVAVTKNTVQTYNLSGSEQCATASGLTESVSVSHSNSANSNNLLVDSDRTGVTASLGYSNAAIGTAGVFVSYSRSNYHTNSVLQELFTPQYLDVTSVGVQIRRPIGARLTGSASVSYSHSDEKPQDLALALGLFKSSFSGFTASGALNYIVGPRLQTNLSFGRSVSAATLLGVGYTVVDNVAIGADYTVSSRITTSVGASWSHTDYLDRNLIANQFTPGNQTLKTIFGRGTVAIGSRSAASLQLRYTDGDADIALYRYNSIYAGLTLSTTF